MKKHLEVLPKFPLDPSLGDLVAGATKADDRGVVSLNIYEVKEGKFDDMSKYLMKLATEYRNIEGLEYTIEVWATAVEAMESLGMTLPG